jgi:hypothetical protein
MPVLGLGQEKTGQESAQYHGYADQRHQPACSENNEQGGRHKELGTPRLGDNTVDGPQDQPPSADNQKQRQDCLHDREPHDRQERSFSLAEQGNQHQEGNDGEILKQQHGE